MYHLGESQRTLRTAPMKPLYNHRNVGEGTTMAGLLVETTCWHDSESEKPLLTDRWTFNLVVADISEVPFPFLTLVTVLTLISPDPNSDVPDYRKTKRLDKQVKWLGTIILLYRQIEFSVLHRENVSEMP